MGLRIVEFVVGALVIVFANASGTALSRKDIDIAIGAGLIALALAILVALITA